MSLVLMSNKDTRKTAKSNSLVLQKFKKKKSLPLLFMVSQVCFACYALLNIRGHSHLPPLIRRYVSYMYLISTSAETTSGHLEPPRECTHLTNRVTSQCELVTTFFQAWKLTDTLSLLCVGGRN